MPPPTSLSSLVYKDDVIMGFKEGSLEVRYFLLNPASIQ
jgi:hypothetical protein